MAGRRPKPAWQTGDLLQVAEMYYFLELSQSAIGDALGRTRQEVSEMLRSAKDRGIVQIRVASPMDHLDLQNLERQLKEAYPVLEDAVVTPGHPTILADSPIPSIREAIAFSVAQAGARYLSEVLEETDVVVVGRGQMVKNLVGSIQVSSPYTDLRIVPMLGFLKPYMDLLDANVIAADLQRTTGGRYFWLPVPAIATKDQQPVLAGLAEVKRVFRLMDQATVVISGIGTITPAKHKQLVRRGFPASELRALSQLTQSIAPLGEMGGWAFGADGQEVPPSMISWRPLGFGLERMRSMVREGRGRVICAVGGDKQRFEAIRGALRGKYVNVLVTDHVTAMFLVNNR